ncbi:unnamed protein product [Lampetra planeri]
MGRDRRARGQRLADLLSAVAVLMAELELGELADRARGPEPRAAESAIATCHTQEARETQLSQAATILSIAWEGVDAISGAVPKPLTEGPGLKKRLPLVKSFSAAGGDWVAFSRRFTVTCALVGWTDREVLQALPTALDEAALGAFFSISAEYRATLQQALMQMAGIFDLPSSMCHRYAMRQWEEAETPLVFRSSLISLAQAVYPKMDKNGLGALVLDGMLGLALDLNIVLPASSDDELTSLKVTRFLQSYLNLKRHSPVAVCAAPAEEGTAADGVESSQAFASLDASWWRRNERGSRDNRDGRTKAYSGTRSSPAVCLKCGHLGHIAKGGDQQPFIQILNTRLGPIITQEGTVLAHASPVDEQPVEVNSARLVAAAEQRESGDDAWVKTLCAESPDLSKDQRSALRALLLEFSDIFSKFKYDIGRTSLVHHHIETGDAAPSGALILVGWDG